MLNRLEPFTLKWTAVPGNNEIAIVWDTTRALGERTYAAVASGSAFLIPGQQSGKFPYCILNGYIRCTGQNVTAKFYGRTEYDGDANDWEIDTDAPNAGTKTVVAGTTWPFSWRPSCSDSLLRIDAGGTAPTILNCVFDVTPTTDYGT